MPPKHLIRKDSEISWLWSYDILWSRSDIATDAQRDSYSECIACVMKLKANSIMELKGIMGAFESVV
jgi:hypothetical protein